MEYDCFTDIEFNPQRSINCQAKAAAIFTGLAKAGVLKEALNDRNLFLKLVEYSRAVTPQVRQAGNRLSGLVETACASLLA